MSVGRLAPAARASAVLLFLVALGLGVIILLGVVLPLVVGFVLLILEALDDVLGIALKRWRSPRAARLKWRAPRASFSIRPLGCRSTDSRNTREVGGRGGRPGVLRAFAAAAAAVAGAATSVAAYKALRK